MIRKSVPSPSRGLLGSEIELHETSAFEHIKEHIDIVEGVQYDVGNTFMIRIVGSSKIFSFTNVPF